MLHYKVTRSWEYLARGMSPLLEKRDRANWDLAHAKTLKQKKKALEDGADVDARDMYDGHTSLMDANTAEETAFFIEAGADVNAKDNDGSTTLMYAMSIPKEYNSDRLFSRKKSLAIAYEQAKLLIEAGVDVNAKSKRGWTALTGAPSVEIALLLIHAGAHVEDLERNRYLSISDAKIVFDTLQKEKEIQKAKERLKNKSKFKDKSGVVIADEIAKRQISGEEKRVITPQVGKELRQEIMKELNEKKSQGK